MTALFQAGGALLPRSKAFDASIYRRDSGNFAHAQDAMRYLPQVIGSPRLSGKTTQVNTIASYHRRLAGQSGAIPLICDMENLKPPRSHSAGEWQVDEESLRGEIASHLASTPRGSLCDILRRSPLLGKARTVLAIINSEKIANSALRWLLTGFRAMYEDQNFRLERKTQLLIDGSFGVETLTAHPDSDYPLPQAYPPEFNESEQAAFLTARLRSLRLQPTKRALRFLWDRTKGDKYLTQVVGKHFWKDVPPKTGTSSLVLDARELRVPLEDPVSWSDLFRPAAGAIGRMVLDLALEYATAQNLIVRLIPEWHRLSPTLKDAAYRGGIVRRISATNVSMRAPMLAEYLEEPLRKATRILSLLHASFSLEGVSMDDHSSAKSALLTILRGSATNEIMTVHVGHGHITSGGVSVKAIALEGGSYEAKWHTPTQVYPVDTPVWALLWTTPQKSGFNTVVKVFKMKLAENLPEQS